MRTVLIVPKFGHAPMTYTEVSDTVHWFSLSADLNQSLFVTHMALNTLQSFWLWPETLHLCKCNISDLAQKPADCASTKCLHLQEMWMTVHKKAIKLLKQIITWNFVCLKNRTKKICCYKIPIFCHESRPKSCWTIFQPDCQGSRP